MNKPSNKQKFRNHLEMITRFGGCNLVAEEVFNMVHLPCYMVYHKYIDYDDTGVRVDGEITIDEDELDGFKDDYLDSQPPLTKVSGL